MKQSPVRSIRLVSVVFAVATAWIFCAGCHDPGYRTDVTATGEGGVTVAHPPSDGPAPATVDPVQSSLQHDAAAQDRAESLEAQLRDRDAQIAQLKLQLATQPAANP